MHLKAITKDNWLKAISLRVRKDEVKFVVSNAVSLAQLNFPENFHAKHVYERIGFQEIDGLIIGDEQVSRFTF